MEFLTRPLQSLDLQSKLLRVLQKREIEPVGAGLTKKLQFRVIAATNEDLLQTDEAQIVIVLTVLTASSTIYFLLGQFFRDSLPIEFMLAGRSSNLT